MASFPHAHHSQSPVSINVGLIKEFVTVSFGAHLHVRALGGHLQADLVALPGDGGLPRPFLARRLAQVVADVRARDARRVLVGTVTAVCKRERALV